MKVKTNKSKSSPKVKSNSGSVSMESKPRTSIEEIENGFIVEKTYTDKNGKYCCEKTYYKEDPLKGSDVDEDEDDD